MGGGGMISAMVLASDDAAAARAAFEQAGFEVGPIVGGTFSITASPQHFEQVLKTRLEQGAAGVTLSEAAPADPQAIPLRILPASLRRHVKLATFEPPPDFGPTDW